MNILQLSKHMKDSGVNSHIIQLSRILTLKEHNVIVVSSGGPHVKELESNGIRHIHIPFITKNPIIALKNLFNLIRIIRREGIDIAHTHWRSTGLYIKLSSILTGIDFVWSNHLNQIPSSWLYRIFTFSGKGALTVSSDMLPMLHERLKIPRSNSHVVFNGVNSEQYIQYSVERKYEIKELYKIKDHKVICLLGRLSRVKGHLYLLESLGNMIKNSDIDISQFKVLFTGDGPGEYKNEIIQKAKSLGLIENIVFTGYVNPVDILNISDLMVLPSQNEGFPIVCVEAFAMKVPVIRSKTGGYSDMKDYCIGIDYGDSKALSESIYDILTNESKVAEMVNEAYCFYKENLTSEKMTEKVIKIYNE
ncbi:glycosyltransferase family 4 protein [Lentibacillus halophilus]|uniref:Glycosyltransferase family 4 protein n=1 Tax=Lentibacillus halophilus TaxID=295065 RepID=A0ABP3IZL2_9BACI